MLIAVPGWPLPAFCTASIASTRTVSMARRSSSPIPSGRVGRGWAGLPVGASLAASAGASGGVLLVPEAGSVSLAVMGCGAPSEYGRGRFSRAAGFGAGPAQSPAAAAASGKRGVVQCPRKIPWGVVDGDGAGLPELVIPEAA